MSSPRPPTAYLIAGPNGAGKTTFATEFLPGFVGCREFVNADLIAAGLAPFAPETQAIRAARLVLTRIKELTAARQDFAVETTLAGRNYVRAIADWKDAGYQVVLIFLWLPTAETAVARVANRVSQGGHGIPAPVIRRRFEAGLCNFFRLYSPLVDSWQLYDGSSRVPSCIAVALGEKVTVDQHDLFEMIRSRWGE